MSSEEHGEKGRCYEKAREARPPERYWRSDGEHDPGAVTDVTQDGKLTPGELAVVEEKIDCLAHRLPLVIGEAVRVTREHARCDTCNRVEGAEEDHPDDESCAGEQRGH